MIKKVIREWKKVFELDLGYIAYELKDIAEKPAVILLDGVMGAGKTTFAKSFIEDGNTFSPSYSVLSETRNVLHADLYRLEKASELIHIELPLYLETKQYFIIEWGSKFLQTLVREIPEHFKYYQLEIEVNENVQDSGDEKASFSRNFTLFELSELD